MSMPTPTSTLPDRRLRLAPARIALVALLMAIVPLFGRAAGQQAQSSQPVPPQPASPQAAPAQPAADAQPPLRPTFRSGVDLVYVNVVVRDRNGAPVRGLKAEDFIVTEDGKPQTVRTFAHEEVTTTAAEAPATGASVLETIGTRRATPAGAASRPGTAPSAGALPSGAKPASAAAATAASVPPPGATPAPAVPADYRGRRLIVLFFDLSAMQPEEIERMSTAARSYIETKLAPADLIAVVSLSSRLEVLQDFTADRERLLTVIARFDPNASEGFQEGPTADDAAASATADSDAGGGEFVPDDSEFNLFNTDRRLQALGDVATTLGGIEQRKSIVYFSGGMGRTGVDNQILLRRTIDQAVRANVAIYAMDSRGLQAVVPGGEAQQGSTRGTGAFSGAAMRGRVDANFSSQEALSALARDTGGQAVFDSNDFGDVFDRVVADTASYYVIGYESTNRSKDGRFRRIKVQVRGDYKVEHRSGYYAGRDFQHSTREDRERQLQDQLTADLSATDLPVYLTAAYFRLAANGTRYVVPVTVAVPGSKIPFTQTGDKAKATLDLLGLVIDERQRPIARVRDTVSLAVEGQNVTNRNIQYQTTLELPPGRYRMKVVVRENEQGTLGSFESEVTVPTLDSDRLKVSSVVMGTRIGATDRSRTNPLTTLAEGLVPNVAPVVSARQRMYFYFEVYDPQAGTDGAVNGGSGAPSQDDSAAGAQAANGNEANGGHRRGRDDAKATASAAARMNADTPVRVLASLSFLRGGTRVYQTGVVDVTRLTAPDRRAAVFRLEVPPASLAPGLYTCQVNIIDDVAGAFAFPRMTLAVRQ